MVSVLQNSCFAFGQAAPGWIKNCHECRWSRSEHAESKETRSDKREQYACTASLSRGRDAAIGVRSRLQGDSSLAPDVGKNLYPVLAHDLAHHPLRMVRKKIGRAHV